MTTKVNDGFDVAWDFITARVEAVIQRIGGAQ